MELLGFIHRNLLPLFMQCLLYLCILAKFMFYRFPMILRVILYLEILGFEVFGSKIPIVKVLDCHNSPWRAITRHGELGHKTVGPPRLQLATMSSCSPPTHNHSPRRVDSEETHCFARLRQSWRFARRFFLRAVFLQK
jgi:hypothetical protein